MTWVSVADILWAMTQTKTLTVGELRQLLADVPDDVRVAVHADTGTDLFVLPVVDIKVGFAAGILRLVAR